MKASAIAVLTLIFALCTFGGYFWSAWRLPLTAALQLAVIALTAAGAGRVLLRVLKFSGISDSQKTLIGTTMGLGVLSLGTLALAAAHGLSGASMALFLAALWLIGFTEMRDVVRSLASNRNLLGDRPVAAAAIFFFLGLVFWLTWMPPHQYDALVYHLPLAQAYVRAHGLTRVEPLIYAHFPQNAEMLFTLALLLRSDLLAQMFMWLAMALSAWWVFEMGKREAPLSAVLLSCLLLVTHTSVMLLSSTSYVEPLVMLWTTAAVFSFLRWRQVRAADFGHRGWLALSAIFTGLALGTKYYAGITAALLGAWLLARLIADKKTRAAAALDLALFVSVVTVLFMPWMVKNIAMAGNPVFPFFNGLFPGAAQSWNTEIARGYFGALTEYRHGGAYFSDFLRFPVMLLTDSLHFGRGVDVLGGLGWELLFWSAPLAVWSARRNRFLRALAWFCGAYLLAWFSTGVVLRFLLALAPLMCLLAGNGLYALWAALEGWARGALAAAVAVLLVCHVLLFFFVDFGVFGSGSVLFGMESRADFLAKKLDYYSCARAAAAHFPASSRILEVGDQRGYYIEQDHLSTSIFAANRYAAWANEARGSAELAARIRREGYGAVLFVPREFERLGPSIGRFNEAGARNWSGLEPNFIKPVYRSAGCTLYTLADSGAR